MTIRDILFDWFANFVAAVVLFGVIEFAIWAAVRLLNLKISIQVGGA